MAALADALEPVVDARARARSRQSVGGGGRAARRTIRRARRRINDSDPPRKRRRAQVATSSAAAAAAARACGTIRAATRRGRRSIRVGVRRVSRQARRRPRGRDVRDESRTRRVQAESKQTRAIASKQTTKQNRASSVSSVHDAFGAGRDSRRGGGGRAAGDCGRDGAAAWTALAGDDHREETPRKDSPRSPACTPASSSAFSPSTRDASRARRVARRRVARRRRWARRGAPPIRARGRGRRRETPRGDACGGGVRGRIARRCPSGDARVLWLQTPTFAASRDVADVVAGLLRRDEHQESFAKNGIGEGAFERSRPVRARGVRVRSGIRRRRVARMRRDGASPRRRRRTNRDGVGGGVGGNIGRVDATRARRDARVTRGGSSIRAAGRGGGRASRRRERARARIVARSSSRWRARR